jgi:hypothetical protein
LNDHSNHALRFAALHIFVHKTNSFMTGGQNASWTSRRVISAVAVLLGVHVCLAFSGILNRSVTSDETAHVTAGVAYWKFNDYRLQPENGNLPQRWGAIPQIIGEAHLDPADNPDRWRKSSVWIIAQKYFFESGNNTDFLLLCSRSMMLFWSVAAGLLVFAWSRSLWGTRAGLGSLALFSISPTTLAHGPLVTSDMCAAVWLLIACAACWRLCLNPTAINTLLFGVATGLAFVAKFSAVLLFPVYGLLAAIYWIWNPTGLLETHNWRIRLPVAFIAGLALVAGIIWCFFGFRYSAPNVDLAPFDRFYVQWDTLTAEGQLWTNLVSFCRRFLLLPEAYLYGFSFVAFFSEERGAFLAGNYSTTGWWWFFPFAFLVKSTIGELLVAALIIIRGTSMLVRTRMATWTSRRIVRSPLLPLLLFAAVYGIFSLSTNLNIGQRHILPLYLVLFILAGYIFSRRSHRFHPIVATIALAVSAIESASNTPHHLAFFNRLAGGPTNGWRLLVDSSLDWGQDVASLGQWVQQNRRASEIVYVSSFGTSDPNYEGAGAILLSPYYTLGKPRNWFELSPGLYCISATMLQDVYGIQPGPWTAGMERDFQLLSAVARADASNPEWDRKIPETGFHPEHPLWLLDRLRFARLCQYLKVRKPDTVINHTQFIYRLSADEIETVTRKPYSALIDLMEAAAERRTGPWASTD